MTLIIDQRLSARAQESVAARFISSPPPEARVVSLALATSDVGVQRNGGRTGSRLGPQALLATFKKLALPQDARASFFQEQVVSDQDTEERDYVASVQAQAENLRGLPGQHDLFHLGGGHDHIYPLLCALADRPIVVINVDAHLDTRTDAAPHSGNPFRRFAETTTQPFHLYQIGIHPFANSTSTQSPLPNTTTRILWREECEQPELVSAFLMRIEAEMPPHAALVFSLDCDAIAAPEMEAVSAPNHLGLSLLFVHQLVGFTRDLNRRRGARNVWGIYEFNPVYDSVSSRSARGMVGLMYRMVFGV